MAVPLTHGRYRYAGDTGPTAGTVFSTPELGTTISTPGVTIQNRIFYGTVAVTAPDVLISNCRIELRGRGIYAIDATAVPVSQTGQTYSLAVENCDIYGGIMHADVTIAVFGNTAIRRCHIHGGTDGVRLNGVNVLLEDSWVRNEVRYLGDHSDVLQTTSGNNIIVRRNRLEAYSLPDFLAGNAAYQVSVVEGPITNLLFEDNFVDNGGYTINGDLTAASNSAVFRNTRFGQHYQVYYTRSDIINGPGVSWGTTNVVDLTSEPVV